MNCAIQPDDEFCRLYMIAALLALERAGILGSEETEEIIRRVKGMSAG